MNGLTLSPSLGWVAGGLLAAAMLAMAVAEIVLHVRRRGASDETAAAYVRRVLVCLLAAVMLLTPSVVSRTASRVVNATDVVLAVDVTGSMAVDDAQYGSEERMTRLDAARRAVDDLTQRYQDASFAAVRFGASGTLDVPLTPDALAIRNWAATLAPEPTDASAGSSLDAPVDQLLLELKSIREQHPDDAIVVYVITDGEQTSARTRRTFSSLRRYADDAFTLGVGSTEGGQVPLIEAGASGAPDDGQRWATDPATGQPGVSRMDEANLKAIADEMGGAYVRLDSGTTATAAVSATRSERYAVTETAKTRTRTTPVVWPFAIALVALLAWEAGAMIVTSRRLL